MLGPHLAKGRGIAGQGTPLIPQDRQRLTKRPASIRDANYFEIVTVSSERGRNNGYAVLGFSECQQGVWGTAFQPNARLEPRNAAGCVKGSAEPIPGVQKQQRIRPEASDLDRASSAKGHRWVTRCKELSGF